jgi:hypothetical protein
MHNCPEAVVVTVNFLLSNGGDEDGSGISLSLRRHPCRLTTLRSTSTLHPPATTASCDGRCRCRPCLPPRRRSTPTSHPSTTTASCDCLCPCLPPRCQLTSRVDINVASYHCHRHARSSLLSSSPSLSPPPFNAARPRRILPPPPPYTIIVVFVVPVPVPVPAACRRHASTMHSPAVTALRDCCRRPCRPCRQRRAR